MGPEELLHWYDGKPLVVLSVRLVGIEGRQYCIEPLAEMLATTGGVEMFTLTDPDPPQWEAVTVAVVGGPCHWIVTEALP